VRAALPTAKVIYLEPDIYRPQSDGKHASSGGRRTVR
jgi:hypothetical protein